MRRDGLKSAGRAEQKAAMEACPVCGSEMEKGYIASKMISWSNKKISNWSLKGLFGGEIILSRGYPYPIANTEAYRCKKCKMVIFKYRESGNTDEDSP